MFIFQLLNALVAYAGHVIAFDFCMIFCTFLLPSYFIKASQEWQTFHFFFPFPMEFKIIGTIFKEAMAAPDWLTRIVDFSYGILYIVMLLSIIVAIFLAFADGDDLGTISSSFKRTASQTCFYFIFMVVTLMVLGLVWGIIFHSYTIIQMLLSLLFLLTFFGAMLGGEMGILIIFWSD